MGDSETKLYRGILYKTTQDVQLTRAEEEKIQLLRQKLNMNEPKQILELYNTMVERQVFHSPVGYEFMMELRNYLILHDVPEMEIRNVQVSQVFAPQALEYREKKMKEKEERLEQEYKGALRKSLWFNIGLAVIVIALFAIMLSSDNPTIINYENKIQNKYASWEQDLTNRENVIRAKEKELGIFPEVEALEEK